MTLPVHWARSRAALAEAAADIVQDVLHRVKAPVIALPTGETPIGLYQELATSPLSYATARFFNLEEYESN